MPPKETRSSARKRLRESESDSGSRDTPTKFRKTSKTTARKKSESNYEGTDDGCVVPLPANLPTRSKPTKASSNSINDQIADRDIVASTEHDDDVIITNNPADPVHHSDVAERLRRSDTPSVSPQRLADHQQRQAQDHGTSRRASHTSHRSASNSNESTTPPHAQAISGQLDGQGPQLSYDPLRSALVRDYFVRNPITDLERALQAYYQKYSTNLKPFDYGDDSPDKLLMCVCLTTDDGRQYLECDNRDKCMKQYFHPTCVGFYSDDSIELLGEWYCPDCVKEGLGGAAAYIRRLQRSDGRPRKVVRKAHVSDKAKAIDIPSAVTAVKPWSADQATTFKDNDDNMRDLNIETLDMAKKTLRERADQPIGEPVAPRPVVKDGTVVKQPNKHSWSKEEDDVFVQVMWEATHVHGLCGNPLWDWVVDELQLKGVDRCIGACRNRWMRGLRESTQIDERRKKNANKLTTAVQIHKDFRDPNSPRKKGKRYQVSRKAKDPPGTLVASSPSKQRGVASSPLKQITSAVDVEMIDDASGPVPQTSPVQPDFTASSPVRGRRISFAVGDQLDTVHYDAGYITDTDDIKYRSVSHRFRKK